MSDHISRLPAPGSCLTRPLSGPAPSAPPPPPFPARLLCVSVLDDGTLWSMDRQRRNAQIPSVQQSGSISPAVRVHQSSSPGSSVQQSGSISPAVRIHQSNSPGPSVQQFGSISPDPSAQQSGSSTTARVYLSLGQLANSAHHSYSSCIGPDRDRSTGPDLD